MSEIREWTRFFNSKINDTENQMEPLMLDESVQEDSEIPKEVKPIGLENPGLFCYVNCAIQCLL